MLTQAETTSATALLYAIRELGRRAGASREQIERWRVAVERDCTTLWPNPESNARIVFSADRLKAGRIDALCAAGVSRYEWMRDPGPRARHASPDLVVPFEDRVNEGPLFHVLSDGEVRCRGDILTATIWLLSRVEERGVHALDEHGRFRASASVAARAGVLERPIVDEYGLALAQALRAIAPSWRAQERTLRVKLSHDIDRIGFPRQLRSTAALLLRHRNVPAFLRDAAAMTGAVQPAYLAAILRTAAISRAGGFDSAFYFKAALRETSWDTGYDLTDAPIRRVMEQLLSQGFEIGLHPGYETFHAQQMLDDEVAHLRKVVGERAIGGRQHYLRWDNSTWTAWERAGLGYDSTMGYAEAMGFRAGTCVPYHPWSIVEDRELALLEIPLVVMDCTPIAYMRLRSTAALARIRALIARTAAVGGVFTLLWHNASVIEPPYARLYPRILQELRGASAYDWRAELAPAPLPQLTHLER